MTDTFDHVTKALYTFEFRPRETPHVRFDHRSDFLNDIAGLTSIPVIKVDERPPVRCIFGLAVGFNIPLRNDRMPLPNARELQSLSVFRWQRKAPNIVQEAAIVRHHDDLRDGFTASFYFAYGASAPEMILAVERVIKHNGASCLFGIFVDFSEKEGKC